jgi:quinoprotein dehydrogenase-associated probable ABC transporter substrate-binding protein
VILGVPQGNDLIQPTNPYYRTTYAIVTRADSDLADLKSLDDPRLKGRRIGLIANTPPGNILAMNGLLGSVKSYALMVDTRIESPSAEMAADLEKGDIDVAILWGPFAGYYAKKSAVKLNVAPIGDVAGARMSFRIAFGVRRSDQNWKRDLNQFIAQNKDALNRILDDYGVPLLGEDGRPLEIAR